jgi:hypothetical protein
MKKFFCRVLVTATLFWCWAASAQAIVFKSGQDVSVPKGETINETLVATGQTVSIDGDVSGDVICAGQNISIAGNVNGDVLCAGQTVDVAGSVTASAAGAADIRPGSAGRQRLDGIKNKKPYPVFGGGIALGVVPERF